MKKEIGKKLLFVMGAVVTMTLSSQLCVSSVFAYTQTTGTVSTDNVKVRAEANTSSSQVSSLSSGDSVDIVDEVTDASGYVWYKIFINNSEYGYVRSDLVTKAGGSSSSTTTTTETTAASLPETQVTAVEQQTATITVETANVRSGAGTAYSSVGTVANGDTVTVTGEATGTDSKKWYQITFNGSSTGFVRSDLLTIGAAAAETTETPAEGTETTETTETAEGTDAAATDAASVEGTEAVEGTENADAAAETAQAEQAVTENNDYEIKYNADADGNYAYYLYDNVEGNYMKVSDLLNLAYNTSDITQLEEQNKKMKAAVIIMAAVLAILVMAIVFLLFRFKDDFYYEEEEDEDEDVRDRGTQRRNTERVKEPVKEDSRREKAEKKLSRSVKEQNEAVETVRPSYNKMKADKSEAEKVIDRKATAYRKATDSINSKTEPSKKSVVENDAVQAPRKPKNFVTDDTMEFEFLDLDSDDDIR
ncbi:MAG: SH3 domain-containing protein [Butyrivibrio sp.]|nr:SH3 domain-containing protein [Butyrivibrio sp.]